MTIEPWLITEGIVDMDVKLGTVPLITVDKDAIKDWVWDFRAKDNHNGSGNLLQNGDTVLSLTITPPAEITLVSAPEIIESGTAVRAWFSFESAVIDTTYKVEAHLVTVDGREDDFPIDFMVVEY